MQTFPNLTLYRFLKWVIFYRQQFVRPLWYICYSKEVAKVELKERTKWTDYGGHHLETVLQYLGILIIYLQNLTLIIDFYH